MPKCDMLTIATFIDGCEQPSDADYEGGLKKRQMVLEFDMATWRVREFLSHIHCPNYRLSLSAPSKYSTLHIL